MSPRPCSFNPLPVELFQQKLLASAQFSRTLISQMAVVQAKSEATAEPARSLSFSELAVSSCTAALSQHHLVMGINPSSVSNLTTLGSLACGSLQATLH